MNSPHVNQGSPPGSSTINSRCVDSPEGTVRLRVVPARIRSTPQVDTFPDVAGAFA